MPGNPVVGGTVLRRAAIQSPNYVTTVSGWTINADGSAEFQNLTFRGSLTGVTITASTISSSTFSGTDFVINASGAFFYSGTPAAGNLVAALTQSSGTDTLGNHYVAGHSSYAGSSAMSLTGGLIQFFTGSLAAGWTAATVIELVAGAVVISGALATANNTLDDGSGNAAFNGSINVGNGATADITLNPAMGIPPNRAAVDAHTATLAQLCAFCSVMFGEMEGRGMFT